MSASIPPRDGAPKWTITVDHGDVHVTVRQSLTPRETDRFVAECLVANEEARKYRSDSLEQLEPAPPTERSGS